MSGVGNGLHEGSPETQRGGISVVIPAYRSTETLRLLSDQLPNYLGTKLFEILIVDDGSPPETWSVIKELGRSHGFVRGIRLGRNYGQHAALLAGIRAAQYEFVLTIDDDLQHPPDQIPILIQAMASDIDVVYGYPAEVAQTGFRRRASKLLRWFLSIGLNQPQSLRATAFCLFRTRIRTAFEGELGPGVAMDALIGWATRRIAFVEVRHDSRMHGRSTYSFRSLARFAFQTIVGYSTLPMRISLRLGFLTIIFGIVTLVWVLGRLVVVGESVAGFPFLASTITIFAGVQLFSLGIIGEYLGIIHQRVMRKPTYFVAEIEAESTFPETPTRD